MKNIWVLNGPNLNLLGSREPNIYGNVNLDQIYTGLKKTSINFGYEIHGFQTNHEGVFIDKIQHLYQNNSADWLIINPAAFTHTSIALRDTILACKIPFIEVHLSNIYKREKFREHSYFSDIAAGVICGFGAIGYNMALQYIIQNSSLNSSVDN